MNFIYICKIFTVFYLSNQSSFDMFKIIALACLITVCAGNSVSGSTPDSKTPEFDKFTAGSQYFAYPHPAYGVPELTPAPEGYEPFHMEHYGRHGSRWLISKSSYTRPLQDLRKADANGKLTPRGKKLLEQIEVIEAASHNRLGELTPKGHRQHRGIARRMTRNFPEIFQPGTHVDGKSTMVIRCILSMTNELAELELFCPQMTVTCDASRTTQQILNNTNTDEVANRIKDQSMIPRKKFAESRNDHSEFLKKIFNDQKFVADSLDADVFFRKMFDIAVNTQSHDDQPDLYDLFTTRELRNQWEINNLHWYNEAGNTPYTQKRVPYNQRLLLRNFIESADTAMTSPRRSANLRFGHEVVVLPMTVFMELNNAAVEVEDMEQLASQWRNYEIFPMASNIQMIFYRPKNNPRYKPEEVLVKVLLNEAETTLPVKAVSGPYYRWSDLRKYYSDKLDSFTAKFDE